jgi:hypothetical protein
MQESWKASDVRILPVNLSPANKATLLCLHGSRNNEKSESYFTLLFETWG